MIVHTGHPVTCPHCHDIFDLSHGLDAINFTVESDFGAPDFVVGDWRFFFRGYLPSYMNSDLIGCALAWNINHKVKRYYGCLPGAEPFSYRVGEQFPHPYGCLSYIDYERHGVQPFINGKKEAIDKLKQFVIREEKLDA